MHTDENTVFTLWCRLTGTPEGDFNEDERRAFLARPQIPELLAAPYELLLDAGIRTARHGMLPLEHWIEAVREASTTASLTGP